MFDASDKEITDVSDTGDSLSPVFVRVVFTVPDERWVKAVIAGMFENMADKDAWIETGTIGEIQAASIFRAIADSMTEEPLP